MSFPSLVRKGKQRGTGHQNAPSLFYPGACRHPRVEELSSDTQVSLEGGEGSGDEGDTFAVLLEPELEPVLFF